MPILDRKFLVIVTVTALIYSTLVIVINKLVGKEAAGVAGVALTALAAAVFKSFENRKNEDTTPANTPAIPAFDASYNWWKVLLISFLFSGLTTILLDLVDGLLPMIFHPTEIHYADFGYINGKLINHYSLWEQSVKLAAFFFCGVIATKAFKNISYTVIIVSALLGVLLDYYSGTVWFILFSTNSVDGYLMDVEDYKYSFLWIVAAFVGSYIAQEKNIFVSSSLQREQATSLYFFRRNRTMLGALLISGLVFLAIWWMTRLWPNKDKGVQISDPVTEYIFLGTQQYDKQDYHAAKLYFDSAAALSANNAQIYFLQGKCAYYLDSLESAVKLLTMAITMEDVHLEESYKFRGFSHYYLKDYKSAIRDLNESIRIEPDQPLVYHYRAQCFEILEEYYNAIADYTIAIEKDPKEPDNYYFRGFCYLMQEKYEQSIKDFNQALVFNTTNKDLHFYRGQAYYHVNEYALAVEDLTKAIAYDNTQGAAYNIRGECRKEMGDQNFCEDFSRASELNDSHGIENYNSYCLNQ